MGAAVSDETKLIGMLGEFTDARHRVCQCVVTGVDPPGLLIVAYVDPDTAEKIDGAYITVNHFRRAVRLRPAPRPGPGAAAR